MTLNIRKKYVPCILLLLLLTIIYITSSLYKHNTNSPIYNLSFDDSPSTLYTKIPSDYITNHFDSYDIVTLESNVPKSIINKVSKIELYINKECIFLIKIYSTDSVDNIKKSIKHNYGSYSLEKSNVNYVLAIQQEIPDYFSYDCTFANPNPQMPHININGYNDITIIEFSVKF